MKQTLSKVGQRVAIINPEDNFIHHTNVPIGASGTIIEKADTRMPLVLFDGCPEGENNQEFKWWVTLNNLHELIEL